MDREIKFDIIFWDGENPETIEHLTLQEAVREDLVKFRENNIISFDKSVIIRQYTGLKDRNGKEIYEGDVVEWDSFRFEIVWDQEMAQLKHKRIDPNGHDDYFELGNNEAQEVIGNIHENPELLEQ